MPTPTQQDPSTADADGAVAPTPGAADPRITGALDLGWRIASLFALAAFCERARIMTGLLPSRTSLDTGDRLELELYAAAADAERLGVGFTDREFRRLRELCGAADHGDGQAEAFQAALADTHVALDKKLWAREKEGRAYELGIMLFDTWHAIRRAYRCPDATEQEIAAEWCRVFGEDRIHYLCGLLDDLQSRLDAGAVAAVRDQLKVWQKRVHRALDAGDKRVTLPSNGMAWEEVRGQALIWRQLLTGDKEPEAYLGPERRAEVRDELFGLMWKRYWRAVTAAAVLVAAAVVATVLFGDSISSWYDDHKELAATITGVVVSAAGVLGISRATMAGAIRSSMHTWSELLWNRALTRVVCRETLRVDRLFPIAPPRARRALVGVQQASRVVLHALPATKAPSAPIRSEYPM